MKLKFLSLMAALLLMFSFAGCSQNTESGSSTNERPVDTENVGDEGNVDTSGIDSLTAGHDFVDGFVNFEENYELYFEDENLIGYTIKEEKKHDIEIDKTISINGKEATLPLSYGDACKAFGLTYDDEADIDSILGQGATVGRSMKTEKGQSVRIALHAEKRVSMKEAQMVGIVVYELDEENPVEFAALGGISNKTSIKGVIDKLGLPSYVSVSKADDAYEIELQYANGGQNGFVSLIYNSDFGGIEELIVEIGK